MARTGLRLHDDTNYGTGFVYRGNVTSAEFAGRDRCMGYETTGVVKGSADGAGIREQRRRRRDTNYSLPGVLTPGGNANLATTVTYAELVGGDERDGAERGERDDDVRRVRAAAEDEDSRRGGDGTYTYAAMATTANTADGDVGDGDDGAVEEDDAGRVRAGDAGGERERTMTNRRYRRWIRSTRRARARRWGSCGGYRCRTRRAGRAVWTTYTYDGAGGR